MIVETSVVYGRQILRGIASYLRTHAAWSVFLDERELRAPPPEWLSQWRGDGVICRSTTPEWGRVFRRLNLPVVDLNDLHPNLGLPRVASDMRAIGRLGAEHLRERGFRNLAFCGFSGETWSDERREGFLEAAQGLAAPVSLYASPWAGLRQHSWQEERNQIARWLQTLPRPAGVMACNDARGQHVLEACGHLGAHVPDDIAVVGVDNADTFCELCNPPLSSVVPNAERIGVEAAALLDRLMAGHPAPRFKPAGRAAGRGHAPVLRCVRRGGPPGRPGPCGSFASTPARESPSPMCSARPAVRARSWNAGSGSTWAARPRRRCAPSSCAASNSSSPTPTGRSRASPRPAGVEHPEYLSVLFKRQTGQTPGQFRRSRQGGPGPDGV